MKLSAIIITKNEEKNIKRAIKSVDFADEVVVIDAESSDRTVEIANSLGAKTFVRPWPGYGQQKNFGAEQSQGEWLLFIDADEEVTPELAQSIQTSIQQPKPDFYWLRIITVFLKKPLHHLYGHNPRLIKKSAGRWTDSHVHEQIHHIEDMQVIKLDDKFSKVLTDPLLHHSHPNIKSYLKKMHRYTSLDASQMARTNQHRSGRPVYKSWLLPWHLSFRQFIKLYIYRKGFLDGLAGLIWCLLSGYYEFEMSRKYLKLVN